MKILYILLLSFPSVAAVCQTNAWQLTTCNDEWKPAKPKKASFLLCSNRVNDTCYQFAYYNMFGPRIRMESFKDEKKSVRHGRWAYYYANGVIDSSGDYLNGAQHGIWLYRNQDGRITHMKEYYKGRFIKDSAIHVAEDNNVPLKPGEIESGYPGGSLAWQHYLQKNFRFPPRAIDAGVGGEVRLQFVINKTGDIVDPEISKSVEFSLDEESMKIITGSGKWEPASKDGKPLNSYKIQPVKFVIVK